MGRGWLGGQIRTDQRAEPGYLHHRDGGQVGIKRLLAGLMPKTPPARHRL